MSPRPHRFSEGLPASRLFVTISHGDSIHAFTLRPVVLWAIVGLAALAIVSGICSAGYLVFRTGAKDILIARETSGEDCEGHLAEAESAIDEVQSRRLVEQNAWEGKLKELILREARIEQHGAIVAALAAQTAKAAPPSLPSAGTGGDALSVIQIPAPGSAVGKSSDLRTTRGFAPIDGLGSTLAPSAHGIQHGARNEAFPSANLSVAQNADLDVATRLELVAHSLDRVESWQLTALADIDRSAARLAAREASTVAETGLDPGKLAAANSPANMGGPYLPLAPDASAPAFENAATQVARDVEAAERLRTLALALPLRKPLVGDATVTSGFGYRADPFLGRLALHSGVDLMQAYGSEIHSTAAGRVVHAGPMGGYGIMVEVDHGSGLTTRYGHMSEVVVAEGDEVAAGALLGRLGSSGRSTGPHLHYEVRVDGEPVDPERFLQTGERLISADQ